MQKLAPEQGLRHAVGLVADDRQVDRGQVDADLVRAAGYEAHPQERMRRPQPLDLEVSDRVARAVRVERLPERRGAITSDRRFDPPPARARPAAYERDVLSLELTPANEALQPGVRL